MPSSTYRSSVAAISPDDRLLALGCTDGGVRFYDLPTRRFHGCLRWQIRDIGLLGFSPDGATIAAATGEGSVYQVHTPVRHDPDTLHSGLNASGPMAYSPDGKTLAVADQDRTIKLIDTRTGRVRTVLQGCLNSAAVIAFSFDGRLAAALSQGEVFLWDASTGARRPCKFTGKGRCIAFSPTRSLLAIGSETGLIYLWDAGSLSSPGSMQIHPEATTALTFSPDGRTLASVGFDRTVHLWDCSGDCAPQKPMLSRFVNEWVHSMAFLPGGRTLLTGGDSTTVRFWQIGPASLTEVKKPLHLSGTITHLDVSRDGQTLLTQCSERSTRAMGSKHLDGSP